jgi:adenosylhomocysteine nucleosidase
VKVSTIGLMGAMDEEVELFLHKLTNTNSQILSGILFTQGEWHGKRVILCKCGVGKVNAAVCTQLLIQHFHVDCIIFTGVAGALDPRLDIGDIIISTDCTQHDMDVTALGFPLTTIPYAEHSIFPADPWLINQASGLAEQMYPGQIYRGTILSGDQFIANRAKVIELHQNLNGICVEMEGAAVGQVCHMNQIPFVIIRSISDKADGSAHVNFSEFIKHASQRSANLVEKLIEHIIVH